MIVNDLDRKLFELDGEQVFEILQAGLKSDGQPEVREVKHTLRSAMTRALRRINPNSKIDAVEKAAFGFLAEKIHRAKKEVELDADEVTFVKDAVADYFGSATVIMEIHRIVDPACIPEKYRIKEAEKPK